MSDTEILNHKTSFVLKMTNRIIITVLFASFGVVGSMSYYWGGIVRTISDHERRIGKVEDKLSPSEQSAKNEVTARKNTNVIIK